MPLQTSGQISLNDVGTFFGAAQPYNINSFYRGGAFVPNVAQNSNIPTANTITLTNFYGAGKTLTTQTFNSSSTFTVPTGINALTITVLGGGGGNGGSIITTAKAIGNGLAGTAGQSITGTLTGVSPGTVYTITVGTGGGFGKDALVNYTAAIASAGTGYNNGSAGATSVLNTTGGGGGGGASSAILLSGTPIIVAAGGKGGDGKGTATTATGGAGGGTNIIPTGFTASTSTNGGVASVISATGYSGSYANGSGSGSLTTIRNTLVSTYPSYYSSIGTVTGTSPDFNFPITLSASTALYASGGSGTFIMPPYSTFNTVLNAGAFAVGNTVSGINFATNATQGNGGSSFQFFPGLANNNGGNGQIVIQYYI